MLNTSFEDLVSSLCRELVQAGNDPNQLEACKRELDDILEERAIVLRYQRSRPDRTVIWTQSGNKTIH